MVALRDASSFEYPARQEHGDRSREEQRRGKRVEDGPDGQLDDGTPYHKDRRPEYHEDQRPEAQHGDHGRRDVVWSGGRLADSRERDQRHNETGGRKKTPDGSSEANQFTPLGQLGRVVRHGRHDGEQAPENPSWHPRPENCRFTVSAFGDHSVILPGMLGFTAYTCTPAATVVSGAARVTGVLTQPATPPAAASDVVPPSTGVLSDRPSRWD